MRTSLKHVAEKSGVSVTTVSCVLNGKAAGQIALRTQERVRQAAIELGYEPNRFARSLQARNAKIIGIVIEDIRNPIFADMLETAEVIAFDAGYQVIADTIGFSRPPGAQSRFHGWPLDGILMWAQPATTVEHLLISADPVVYMGYPRTDGADFVAIDRFGGAKEMVKHLLERGRRRIAYARPYAEGEAVRQQEDDRASGYLEACAEAGVAPRMVSLVELRGGNLKAAVGGRRPDGFATGLELAALPEQDRPDAVFCYSDLVALGLREGLKAGGLRVPQDVAVAGSDGLEEGLYLSETLTTIVLPVRRMCEIAIEFLVRRLTGIEPVPAQQLVLPTHIHFGGTT
ncbi:MAG: LacI family DNA-binding transcriptional regulator [Capsulimonadaceae bacterium]|nr:LacI family DNA-binding transcriptional regulator [Capsulimonadaceae bacterium]